MHTLCKAVSMAYASEVTSCCTWYAQAVREAGAGLGLEQRLQGHLRLIASTLTWSLLLAQESIHAMVPLRCRAMMWLLTSNDLMRFYQLGPSSCVSVTSVADMPVNAQIRIPELHRDQTQSLVRGISFLWARSAAAPSHDLNASAGSQQQGESLSQTDLTDDAVYRC